MEVTLSPADKLGISVRVVCGEQRQAALIATVFKGSAAEESGKLHVGQEVLEVNGTALLGKSEAEVVALLAAPSVTLRVTCQPLLDARLLLHAMILGNRSQAKAPRLIALRNNVNGIGFAITGPAGDSAGMVPSGIFVTRLHDGAPEGLQVGDRVLAVSSKVPGRFAPLSFATREEAAASLVMAKAGSSSSFIVVAQHIEGYAFASAVENLGLPTAALFTPSNAFEIAKATKAVLRVLEALPSSAEASAGHGNDTGSLASPPRSPERRGGLAPPFFVEALFQYQSTQDGELSLTMHDILEVVAFDSAEKWTAQHVASGSRGFVPSPSKWEALYRKTPQYSEQVRAAQATVAALASADEQVPAADSLDDTPPPSRLPSVASQPPAAHRCPDISLVVGF
jgi:hypothetical protein